MMSDYEKEPTTSPEDSSKETGGKMDLPQGFAPLASPVITSPISPSRAPSMEPSDLSGKPEVEESVEGSAAPSFKPMLARYPVRKPAVKVALLDPAKVYAKKEENEPTVPYDIVAPVSEGFLEEVEPSDDKSLLNKSSRSPVKIEIEPVSVLPELVSPISKTGEVEVEGGDVEEVEAEGPATGEVGAVKEVAQSKSLAGGVDFGSPETEIKPLKLKSLGISASDEEAVEVVEREDSNYSVLDDIELTLDEENALVVDSEDLSVEEKDGVKPNIPDPDEVAELVARRSESSSEVEVLGPERQMREELSVPKEKVNKWAFWKRPSKREQQLARISEGYLEMVDLVRTIRGQLESQNENNVILRESLIQLPDAMKGFDQGLALFSKSQVVVGKALGEINTQMKSYNEKDERLVVSMESFNDTLKGMNDTSKATNKTFDRVQERMRDSDIRMENLFQNVQNTEEKVSDTMVRLQRNMAVMQYIFLGCLMVVIGVLVFTVIMKNDESDNSPRIEQTEPTQVPEID